MQISFADKHVLEKMILKTIHVLPSNILEQLDHMFKQELLSDHRTQLMKIIIQQYLEIRLHYAASTEEEKKRATENEAEQVVVIQRCLIYNIVIIIYFKKKILLLDFKMQSH